MPRLAALLLLALLPSCAMVGHGTQRSVEAAGVATTSVIGTPLLGFASWPLWNWLGGYAGTGLSGTEEIRVKARGEAGDATGGPRTELTMLDPGDPFGALPGGNMFWIVAACVGLFLWNGGWTWIQARRAEARKDEDDAWVKALDKDRAEHAKVTAALTAKVEMLEKLLVKPKR